MAEFLRGTLRGAGRMLFLGQGCYAASRDCNLRFRRAGIRPAKRQDLVAAWQSRWRTCRSIW